MVAAVRDLALGSVEALVTLASKDPAGASEALSAVADLLYPFTRSRLASDFKGTIIDADWADNVTESSAVTGIGGKLA